MKYALDSFLTDLKKFKYFICFGDTNSLDAETLRFKDAGFNIANGGNQGWFVTAASGVKLELMKDAPNKHIDNIINSSLKGSNWKQVIMLATSIL